MKLLLLLMLVACGGKKDEAPKGDSSKNAPPKSDPKPTEAKPTPPAPTPQPPAKDYGSCDFTISGGLDVKEKSTGGMSAVSASYWMPDEKQKRMLYGDKQGAIINCNGPTARLSFTAGDQTDATLPMGPKKYDVKPTNSVFPFLGRVGDVSLVGAEGTLDITAFDKEHIAGTFDVKAKTMGKDASKDAAVTIKGSFDFRCPTCGK